MSKPKHLNRNMLKQKQSVGNSFEVAAKGNLSPEKKRVLGCDERCSRMRHPLVEKLPGPSCRNISQAGLRADHAPTEEQPLHLNTFLDTIVENFPHAMGVSDETGTLIKANQALRDLCRATDEDIVGKYNVLQDDIITEQGYGPRLREVFEKGKTVNFILDYDSSLPRRSGPMRPGRVILDVTVAPVFDDTGGIAGAIIQKVDVTQQKLTEKALRESEHRFKLLYEQAPMPYQSLDENGNLLEVNHAWLHALGYTKEEVLGRNFADFLQPEWDAHFRENFPRFKDLGEILGVEFEITKKDGSTMLVAFNGKIGRTSEGRFKQTHCIFHNITEQRQAEQKLRESEQRFRSLFEHSPLAYQSLDAEGFYIDVNEQLCELLGYSSDEFLGRSFGDFWTASTRDAFPQTFAAFKREGRVTGELLLVAKDGREVSVILEGRIEKDADGRFLRTHCTLTDITRRKEAEEEADIQRQTLSKVFENAPYVMMLVDAGGRVININHKGAVFAGRTKEELLGLLGGEVMGCLNSFDGLGCGRNPECSHCPVRTKVVQTLETAESIYDSEGRLTVRRESAEVTVDILVSTTLVRDRDADKVLVTITDVTDRKRAQEEREKLQGQLLQAQKMEAVGRLAGGVAHDFNNMLGVILGHTELALDQTCPEDPRYLELQEIHKATQYSADLTRQLLAFARKQTVSPQALNLNDAVSSMIKMLQRLIGEDIDLSWKPGHSLWNVKIDPCQLDQVLANLAINARDAIAGVGKVTIETANTIPDELLLAAHQEFVPGEYVLLSVSDDGAGMSRGLLEHIFEPFFTTKEVGRGTGLGLATVYGIVKQNQGFVYACSEPGQGATFKIYLPRHKDAAVQANTKTGPDQPPVGHEVVLIVEDEPAIMHLGKRILDRLGYAVMTARTPGAAIQMVKEGAGNLQLLITDVIMPEMNGKELAQQLISLNPGLKCLFMSGYTADVIACHGVLDEGVHFIQKPFSVTEMATKVREILD